MDQRLFPKSGKTASGGVLPKYDVSIILNLHNEARYLKRTMLSLEDAVRYARQFEITFEIVVVLDNADKATTALAEAYDYSVFDAAQIIRVRNGSLGLSRNDGIAASNGAFVTTADGDDLISFDFLYCMYMKLLGSDEYTIVIPEYCVGFGAENYLWKAYSSRQVGNSALFENHPYLSRIIAPRELFDKVKYHDSSSKTGFSFEDWQFSANCIANGYSIDIAPDCILFYRKRADSLLKTALKKERGLIGANAYFVPETYARLTWSEHAGRSRATEAGPTTISGFINAPGVAEAFAVANRIDPAISLGIFTYAAVAGNNLHASGPVARAYFEVCQQIAGETFTDILLVPFFAKGGAEKYILSVIDGLRELQPRTKLLVLSAQKFTRHAWLERLPEGSLFIDLQALGVPGLDESAIQTIVFRLVQNLPGVRRLHMKNCEFVDAFARKYAPLLKTIDTIFYHFCDPAVTVEQISFVNGQSFDLVSEVGHNFSHVVSDHGRNIELIHSMIGGEAATKSHTLYTECSLPVSMGRAGRRPSKKLLWASRIDGQKRPELLKKIAQLLEKEGLDIGIDAYGGTTYGKIGPEVFAGASLLHYKGGYDDFGELPTSDYDGFVYTAAFDGLPNVVLEALAAELPVVAPDVGGIGEAVTDKTGFLVDDDPDPDRLAERFVEAIKALYADWPEAVGRGENGRRLIAERHSRPAFLKQIAEVFGVERASEPAPGARAAGRPAAKAARRTARQKERA